MPEFVVPQDGCEKQDCERNAAKRWLQRQQTQTPARGVTYLGDDLYACQPICQLIVDSDQYFVCVAKPESHAGLYAVVTELEHLHRLHHVTQKHWNGRHYELWVFRFASDLPLRSDVDTMFVNWLEVTVTDARTGKRLYFNTWVTNHVVSVESVYLLAKAGRARWKIENENNMAPQRATYVLKNHGYHLEHNFGHGKHHLSNVLFTLNLLAFLTHTVQELIAKPYQLLRAALKSRQVFFNDLRALTRHHIFDSWQHLWRFMLESLEIVFDPALLFSD